MNAHAPPVKTKRAGDLAATSPNCFEVADDTPLVCGAQDECEHSDTRIAIESPGSVHFAREVCCNCDRVLRFLPKPANAFRLANQAQWHREADRLLAEYKRTLNPRHFVAWSKHVTAMREKSER